MGVLMAKCTKCGQRAGEVVDEKPYCAYCVQFALKK